MKRLFITFFILTSFQHINAQYTDIINSKRPGFSESPYSVGTDVYQFETGFFYKKYDAVTDLEKTTTRGGELFFRFGKFLDKLEVNLNVAYQRDEINNPVSENSIIKGLSNLTFGAKYLIYQQEYTDKSKEIRSWKRKMAFDKKRLIPSVGIYGGINTNFLSEGYKKEGISFKGALLLQNDFSDRLVLLTNLIADEIGSENILYSYITTLTYAISPYWSFFVENTGKYQKGYHPEYQSGTGIAYLVSSNLQIDASLRSNLVGNYSYIYASTGIAWRLNRHQDPLINPNTSGKKNRGFFSRLFRKN